MGIFTPITPLLTYAKLCIIYSDCMCSHVLFELMFRTGTSSTTFIKGKKMKQSLLVAALLAIAVTACGKKEAPAAAPAAPAAAPAPAPAAK